MSKQNTMLTLVYSLVLMSTSEEEAKKNVLDFNIVLNKGANDQVIAYFLNDKQQMEHKDLDTQNKDLIISQFPGGKNTKKTIGYDENPTVMKRITLFCGCTLTLGEGLYLKRLKVDRKALSFYSLAKKWKKASRLVEQGKMSQSILDMAIDRQRMVEYHNILHSNKKVKKYEELFKQNESDPSIIAEVQGITE